MENIYSDSPTELVYTERNLITLIRMMKSAVEGKHHELDVIAASNLLPYPAFSEALTGLLSTFEIVRKASVINENQRELYQRLYTAEQLKTQALIEHIDL